MNRILINYKLALKTDTFMRINFNLRRIYIMKSFWNDYWDLVKESTDFYKKHWAFAEAFLFALSGMVV